MNLAKLNDEQFICKSIEDKIRELLKPNNNERLIAKKMAYLREHLDLNDYVGYDELITDLDELKECDNCKELEHEDDMQDGFGFDNLCPQCSKEYYEDMTL